MTEEVIDIRRKPHDSVIKEAAEDWRAARIKLNSQSDSSIQDFEKVLSALLIAGDKMCVEALK